MPTANPPLMARVVKQASSVPTRKVMAGGVAGALTTVLVFVLNTYVLPMDKPLTAEIAAALTTIFSFAFSYLVPPAVSDQVTDA